MNIVVMRETMEAVTVLYDWWMRDVCLLFRVGLLFVVLCLFVCVCFVLVV